MALMWTIPGTVLLSGSLHHLRFTEAIGAMLVSGVLIFLLGLTGWVKRLMNFCKPLRMWPIGTWIF